MTQPKDTNDYVSKAEVETLVRSAIQETIKQVTGQATQEVQSLDMTRQIAPSALPEDSGVSLHENPDEKSKTEKSVGALDYRVQQAAAAAIEQNNNLRAKLDDAYAAHFTQSLSDEREAARNHRSRNSAQVFEVDPLQSKAIQELHRTDPEYIAAIIKAIDAVQAGEE